jgi:hypothetical protein
MATGVLLRFEVSGLGFQTGFRFEVPGFRAPFSGY